MNKIQTRIVSLLVAITITIGLLPGLRVNAAVVASGDCGANGEDVIWTLDDAGVLTISGTGDMEDYHLIVDSSIGAYRMNYPWYEQKNSIKNVVIEDGVTSIGEYSFFDLEKLNSVTISNSVTEIGDSAFSSCSDLSSVDLPDNLVTIGGYAFAKCYSLQSIEFPDTLTTIDFSAFQYAGLTSITIPGSVTTIGETAFEHCLGLKTVKLNEGIEIIDDSAFIGCEGLTNISIPVSVTTIETSAFAYCTGLTSFEADAVLLQKMDFDSVFKGCERNSITITAYTFPITYNTCSHGAVSGRTGCPSTDSVEVTVEPDDDYVALTVTVTDSKGTTIIKPNDEGKYIFTMPSEAVTVDATFAAVVDSGTCGDGVNWTLYDEGNLIVSGSGAINNNAFKNRSDIKTVVIEEGITGIGAKAFYGCDITSVEIPSSVNSIGESAFQYCMELTSVEIPGNVKGISKCAFSNCYAMTSLTINDGVQTIGDSAFYGCKFTDLTIPDSVETIEDKAFYNCSNLTSITIPGKVSWIGNYAFKNCSSLTWAMIPSSVVHIGTEAFANCTYLSDVLIDEEDYSSSAFPNIPSDAIHHYYELKVNGGSADKNVDLYEGCIVTITADVPDGNSFFKWITDSSSIVFNDENSATTTFTMPAEDVEITALMSKCTVTFDSDYGTVPSPQVVDNGETVSKPDAPSHTELVFTGWSTNPSYLDEYDFDSPVTGDLTLYAIWIQGCTVTFDVNGHGDAPSQQLVAWRYSATKPDDPTATGYTFAGWYKEPECTTEYDFDSEVRDNLTLYAKWTCDVSFDTNGKGTAPSTQTVADGSKAIKPSDPTATGYTFGGWYTDSACTTEYDFDSEVTANVTLYAKWTVNTYTIKFVTTEGTVLQTGSLAYGTTPSYTGATPTKAADEQYTYTFSGWTPAITTVTADATYTATFTKTAKPTPAPTPEPASEDVLPAVTSGIAHVQDVGNVTTYADEETGFLYLGTEGQGKRLESITLYFDNPTSYSGTLEYRVHVQDLGWTDWVTAGNPAGTEGMAKRIEAIEIRLTGELADNYSVFYGVHIQDYGDMQGWVQDGALAGTTGESKRIEALAVVIVPKGTEDNISVQYRVHVQDYGWESSYAFDGQMAGTSGQSKRLEGIEMFITGCPYSGGIQYKTHIQDIGWESGWTKNGEMSGTQGQSKRLEGICIELYGEVAEYYDIYYRVHAQDIGWMAWAKNGECAGTAGRSARLEGIQIVLVPKGDPAPSATYEGITAVTDKAFIEGF